ncbi:hypothetical protein N015_03470 [Pseudomonas asturiensis]|uniref:BIG2 domain-containing protein n=1 Tax=Pseudomonas asturiensis TaxID=1190415 RepID=A0ABX6H7M2_9PSED|nr:Ig-like domain-containing protein [Pseudomonas asturiensis]QHF01523.1 hypothetical protein N015_03470 [Pseudomonas asturiensis]
MTVKTRTRTNYTLASKPTRPSIGERPHSAEAEIYDVVDLPATEAALGLSRTTYNLGGGPLPISLSNAPAYKKVCFNVGDVVRLELVESDTSHVIWQTEFTWSSKRRPGMTSSRVFYIPYDTIKAVAGKLLYVICTAQFGLGKSRISDKQQMLVKGLPVPAQSVDQKGVVLPDPLVLEAIGDVIDPDHISVRGELKYITVAIDYPMELGDVVKLSMIGRDVDQNEVEFTDKERPISESNLSRRPLTITFPDTQIKPLVNGLIRLSYKVGRGGVWQSSAVRTISVGPSLSGLPPFINEVKDGRLNPDLILQSINVHIPSAGTRVGDRVVLYWNDTSRKRPFTDKATVTQLNVDGDLSFDIYADEVIDFNRGKMVTVFYTIERESAEAKASYRSGDYRFFVGNEQEQRAASSVVPALPKVVGVSDGIMDPASAEAGVSVTVPFSGTSEGDSVTTFWQPDGEAAVSIGTVQVDAANVDSDLEFVVSAQAAKSALNKKVTVYYVITRKWLEEREQKLRSKEVLFRLGAPIISGPPPAPVIGHLDDDFIDPMDVTGGETVTVKPYPSIAVGDQVKLYWVGMAGNGTPDLPAHTVADVTTPLVFNISAGVIGWNMGSEVWVYYQVVRQGVAKPVESEIVVFEVDVLGEDHLPKPSIDQASGNVLDLSALSENVTVSLKQWPFMQPRQRVWIRLQGITKDDRPWSVLAWYGRLVTTSEVSQGMSKSITRSRFDNVKDGSSIKVCCTVTYDGDHSEKYADAFPVLTLTVRQPAPVAPVSLGVSPAEVSLVASYPPGSNTPVGGTFVLNPFGGVRPYRFESDDSDVAEVSDQGVVKAVSNGEATVSVHDADGAQVSVSFYVEGFPDVYLLECDRYEVCEATAKEDGAELATLSELRRVCTDPENPLNFGDMSPVVFWTRDTDESETYRTLYLPLEDLDRKVAREAAEFMTAYGAIIVLQAQYEFEEEEQGGDEA